MRGTDLQYTVVAQIIEAEVCEKGLNLEQFRMSRDYVVCWKYIGGG
jgi:hypothetical protein